MENLGALSLLTAFCLALYAVAASLVGAWRRKPYLVRSGERAVYAIWGLLTAASGILIYALVNGDFRLAYVAAHTNRAMPVLYKVAAWWGGQEGSLLLWSWLLAGYSAMVVAANRKQHRRLMPYIIAVLMLTQGFFLLLNTFVVSPFRLLAMGGGVMEVPDGNGLNPLLQHPAMAIHPPMLYLGFVGFAVPFAFAMASLITRHPGEGWIHTTRRWTLVTWMFQSIGILLGAGWAYEVLGWGGYWGWDPVENASLLPWITATAFLHSVMMQEKKGMMKVWNMVMISATFFLCIFGTFLTRSGLVSSVHAFAQSPIGRYFVVFLAAGIAATIYLILDRLDYLKSEARLESVLSRESAFLFNTLILLACAFVVLWGTLFPVISEAITGEKISVDTPFLNRVTVPSALFLLFLTGGGPLIAWRRSSPESLKRNFLWPGIAALVLMAALVVAGVRHFYATVSLGLCLFVVWTIVAEFYKGSRAIRTRTGLSLPAAAVELAHRNTRRYGGYIVHLGIVLMFIGFTGSAFNRDTTAEVKVGDGIHLAGYDLKVQQLREGENENYSWHHAVVEVFLNGRLIDTLEPERRIYKTSRQGTSEVAIRRRLHEDLYLNFAGMTEDGQRAVIQAYVFPLVSWIWIGFWVLLAGTLVCLIPSKVRLDYARTELVEVAEAGAKVERTEV